MSAHKHALLTITDGRANPRHIKHASYLLLRQVTANTTQQKKIPFHCACQCSRCAWCNESRSPPACSSHSPLQPSCVRLYCPLRHMSQRSPVTPVLQEQVPLKGLQVRPATAPVGLQSHAARGGRRRGRSPQTPTVHVCAVFGTLQWIPI